MYYREKHWYRCAGAQAPSCYRYCQHTGRLLPCGSGLPSLLVYEVGVDVLMLFLFSGIARRILALPR